MKLIPLTDKVIVKRETKENKTDSGIYLGEIREQIYFGIVVEVGEGKTFENGITVPLKLKVGDKVCWSYMQGTSIEIDGEEFYIIVEDSILCKVK